MKCHYLVSNEIGRLNHPNSLHFSCWADRPCKNHSASPQVQWASPSGWRSLHHYFLQKHRCRRDEVQFVLVNLAHPWEQFSDTCIFLQCWTVGFGQLCSDAYLAQKTLNLFFLEFHQICFLTKIHWLLSSTTFATPELIYTASMPLYTPLSAPGSYLNRPLTSSIPFATWNRRIPASRLTPFAAIASTAAVSLPLSHPCTLPQWV